MKILYFPQKKSSNIVFMQLSGGLDANLCYTVTCNNPEHGIKRPG